MSNNKTAIEIAFENNPHKIAEMSFAREVFQTHKDICVFIPLKEVESFFSNLRWVAPENNDKAHNYINDSLEKVENIKRKGHSHYNLFPANAYFIVQLCDNISCEKPDWLPEVTKLNEPNGIHDNTFLFHWDTVTPSTIPGRLHAFFVGKLEGKFNTKTVGERQPGAMSEQLSSLKDQIKTVPMEVAKSKGSALSPQEDIVSKLSTLSPDIAVVDKASVKKPRLASIITTEVITSDSASNDYVVAKLYCDMVEAANKEQSGVSISLSETMELLANPICYYTDKELSLKSIGDKESVSLFRLDLAKGYTVENIAVCASEMADMREKLSDDEFEQIITMKKLMNENKLSPAMMDMMMKMTGTA